MSDQADYFVPARDFSRNRSADGLDAGVTCTMPLSPNLLLAVLRQFQTIGSTRQVAAVVEQQIQEEVNRPSSA